MEVYVPVDRSTGNGRGFAFVTMKEEDVETAIAQTNGLDFEGRKLVVSVPLRKCVTRMKCEHPIPPACYVCLLELTLFICFQSFLSTIYSSRRKVQIQGSGSYKPGEIVCW